jgi:hypothetical protein
MMGRAESCSTSSDDDEELGEQFTLHLEDGSATTSHTHLVGTRRDRVRR